MSSRFEHAVLGNDVIVQLARYVSLDASYRLELGVSLRHLAGHLSASPVVRPQPSWRSDVYRAVRCPASAPVEPVARCEPRRHRTRCHPAQASRTTTRCLSLSGLSLHGDHQLDSALRADALLLEDGSDGRTELAHLVEVLVAIGERLEGDAPVLDAA